MHSNADTLYRRVLVLPAVYAISLYAHYPRSLASKFMDDHVATTYRRAGKLEKAVIEQE